ncbi:MAG: glucan biosynthesis protein, partial [Acidiferrobacteraceae bacterium]
MTYGVRGGRGSKSTGAIVCALFVLFGSGTAMGAVSPAPFGLSDVAKIASALAAQPYRKPQQKIPKFLLKLTYSQYQDIRFRPNKALWRRAHLPFRVEFFHPGFYFNRSVKINVIGRHGVSRIPFSASDFSYG